MSTKYVARSAVTAAIYALLTLIFQPISFGAVQACIAEALTLLPILMPEAIPGLAVGCVVANLIGGAAIYDVLFGSLATLLAAVMTRVFRNKPPVAAIFPVVFNAVITGAVVYFCYEIQFDLNLLSYKMLLLTCLYVGVGEALVVYALGLPAAIYLKKRDLRIFRN